MIRVIRSMDRFPQEPTGRVPKSIPRLTYPFRYSVSGSETLTELCAKQKCRVLKKFHSECFVVNNRNEKLLNLLWNYTLGQFHPA